MGDQSHLEAMREAIRGDLERARARRPSIFERPAPPPVEIRAQPAPAPVQPELAIRPPDEPCDTVLQGATEPEHAPATEPVVEAPAAAATAPRRLLDRLAFWRR